MTKHLYLTTEYATNKVSFQSKLTKPYFTSLSHILFILDVTLSLLSFHFRAWRQKKMEIALLTM